MTETLLQNYYIIDILSKLCIKYFVINP